MDKNLFLNLFKIQNQQFYNLYINKVRVCKMDNLNMCTIN